MSPKINISRRKFIGTALITLIGGLNLATARENKNTANDASLKTDAPNARLGINLAAIKNYSTELPFVDLFRMAAGWVVNVKKENGEMGPH